MAERPDKPGDPNVSDEGVRARPVAHTRPAADWATPTIAHTPGPADAHGETLASSSGVVLVNAPRASTDELAGLKLSDRYTLIEPLGHGGMSVVYLARHELLKKEVAIKLLRDELAQNKEALQRFHREAMAAASIGNPHIIHITDYGFTDGGDAFIVMERLVGRDLRKAIAQDGAFEAGRVVSITRQILRALVAAHSRGIVHRDLKAENVFLEAQEGGDFVKLLDFGISKIMDAADEAGASITSTGAVMGTPQYIAPEQASGETVDHRADIYALGVIIYEMLTGSLPFKADSALKLVMAHVQEKPEPPTQRRPDLDIPPALERLVLRALEKKPAARFASAEEMLESLPDATTLPGGFSSTTLPRASSRSNSRWAAVAIAALLVASVATYAALSDDDEPRPSRAPRALVVDAQITPDGTAPPDASVARDEHVAIEPAPESAPPKRRPRRRERPRPGAPSELHDNPYLRK